MIKRKRKLQIFKTSIVLRNGCIALAAILLLRLLYSFGIVDSATTLLKKAGQNPEFITKALSWELDSKFNPKSSDSVLQEAFISQSPYLEFTEVPQTDPPEEEEDTALLPLNYVSVNIPATNASSQNEKDPLADDQEDPGSAIETNLLPTSTNGYLYYNGIYIKNQTGYSVDLEQMYHSELSFSGSDGPKILILHTHGSEAYHPAGEDLYQESDPRRTEDNNYNVTRLGNELTAIFESYGIETLHSSSLHDYPSYSGSYSRSLETIEDYLAQYPSIEIVIDLHRDSLADTNGTEYKTVTEIDGKKTSQIMFVVGTDEGGLEHPNWTNNLALAVKLQTSLESAYPSFARPISLRSSRFNQHATAGSLLVEVGCSGNTLQESLRAVRLFGAVTAQALIDMGI